jgi:hypothetical protein
LAELVEYGLVVLASAFVMVFSIASYTSYASSVSVATQRADYSSYVTLAYAAMERGNSSAGLTLENTTLECHQGSLVFGSPALAVEDSLPVGCQFDYHNLNGPRRLSFSYSNGVLNLEVS